MRAMDAKALSFAGGLTTKGRLPGGQQAGVECGREGVRAAGMLRRPQPPSMRSQAPGAALYTNGVAEATGEAQLSRTYETVGDVMTSTVISVTPETKVIDALELIVEHRITGMPVVDAEGKVVGVVSDYDLLALDMSTPESSQSMFPSLDQSWQAFRNVQALMSKVEGQTVGDVMTEDPVVVRPNTSLDMAARILLESKIRRLPVLDKDGKLIGLLSRRNIVVAALAARRNNDTVVFGNNVGRMA